MSDKKISKLARASFIMPVLLWGAGLVLCRLSGPLTKPVPSSGLRGFLAKAGCVLLTLVIPVSLVLAALAIRRIKKSRSKLTGTYLALAAVVVAILLFMIAIYVFLEIRFVSEAISN